MLSCRRTELTSQNTVHLDWMEIAFSICTELDAKAKSFDAWIGKKAFCRIEKTRDLYVSRLQQCRRSQQKLQSLK
jgi:hypothetical protein